MSTRRSHTKSRTGCINCKRRKVKCDEVRPTCFHCRRHGVPCSLSAPTGDPGESPASTSRHRDSALFPNLTPSTPGSTDGHATGSSAEPMSLSHPSPSDPIAPFPPQELWSRDCELMHHYCTVTAHTLSVRQDLVHVWTVAVPREGYSTPFVMHGLLAIAAAHKAYLMPASRGIYLPLADYHQTLGSEGYRRELQTFNATNWMPVFSFASVVVLQMLTLPTRMENRILEDPIRNLMELTGLLRGIRTTLQPIIPRVVRTPFAPVVYAVFTTDVEDDFDVCPPLENTLLSPDTWDELQRLRAFQEADLPSSSVKHYLEAVKHLQTGVRLFSLAGTYVEPGAVFFWLYVIDDSIVIDFSAHRPHALLVFAYFIVLFAAVERNFWFMRGWAGQTIIEIEAGLAGQPKFLELLQWPKRRIAESIGWV